MWLIEKAAWKPCVRRNAKGERVQLDRGQFHTSLRNLGEAWSWGKNKVARFLERLEDHEMIGTVAGQSGCTITICNYDVYQDARDSSDQDGGTVAGQSRDTQEEGKEYTSVSKDTSVVMPRASEKGHRIPANWHPGPLPATVAALVAQWPPGREERELEGFRDYWEARTRDAARSDWDKVWHNRIRDQHDRVLRENRNGSGNFNSGGRSGVAEAIHTARDRLGLSR
ncbi:hypothetical protein [Sphingobium indicum]|uniref:hypothetical protein n=1 Tax=Sphingobium indicum TaxID=332055 RepID=UPI0002640B22|nr:hypothetical protein [Sphingobium indicum]